MLGGLAWSGFQLWPRGAVERSLVRAFAALPHFVERTDTANPFLHLSSDAESTPAFTDLDGDGAQDLLLGSRSGELRIFLNQGTPRQPRFLQPSARTFGLVAKDTSMAIAFADLHATGLADALSAGTNGSPTSFANRGTRQRPDFVLLAPEDDPLTARTAATPTLDWRPVFADIDHDGDFDLFVGTRAGSILFFENRGTAQRPIFADGGRVDPFGLHSAGTLSSVALGDLDGDGDLDALTANAAGELRYLENRGTPSHPRFVLTAAGSLGLPTVSPEATVTLIDLDADGDLDCLTGAADGHLRYFENLSTPAPPAPTNHQDSARGP